MRRPVWSVLLGLLFAVAHPGAAQQRSTAPAMTLEAPRPLPILPAVLVPFQVADRLCGGGQTVLTTLKVYDGLAREVGVLRLRDGDRSPLNGTDIGCGRFVAVWDGTLDNGSRLATNGVYSIQLRVSGVARPRAVLLVVPKLG
jgi:hypothetical protein